MGTSGTAGGPPPQAIVMQMVTGAWVAQTISAVTRLDVPDLIQKHGPLTARQLTESHGVDAVPELLERALRACASVRIFSEDADGRFGSTPLSEVLTLSSPASVKRFVEMIGGRWWQYFTGLPDILRMGQNQSGPQQGAERWEGASAKEMEDFGEAMKSRTHSTRGVLAHCDLSRARTVVDVGGGFGHLAIALLQQYPHLHALVLDVPKLVPIAERHAASEDRELLARLSFIGGDMFEDVPPGDTYILKGIIHDWDDQSGLRVLRNCQARMQGDGRVLCVDNVLPPMGNTGAIGTKFLDMLMMVSLPGKERTEAEWRSLYDRSGLAVASITPINRDTGESIVEGVKQ